MREKKKKLSPYKRKVHVDGSIWTYQVTKAKIGSSGYLKLCNPSQTKKYTIEIENLGKSSLYDDIEACPEEFMDEDVESYKNALTPKMVVKYIRELNE